MRKKPHYLNEEPVSRIGYVLGCYDPEDCSYKYFGHFGFQPQLHGASVFENEEQVLRFFDEKKNGYCPDGSANKRGLRIMTSKVFIRVERDDTRLCCPKNVTITKYNHYQKLASIMT